MSFSCASLLAKTGTYKVCRKNHQEQKFGIGNRLIMRIWCLNNKIWLQDVTTGRSFLLALQTLGVVFGDVGTSPLYTFSVMFSKAPVNGDEDVLGALSLVLYTLILIPLIKYVLIVLLANDDGEGMQWLVSRLPFNVFICTRLNSYLQCHLYGAYEWVSISIL